MPSVGTLTRPSSLRPTAHQAFGVGAAAIVVMLVLAAAFAAVRGPAFVDHVTIDNRSDSEVHVVVRSSDGGGALGLAVVDPDRSTRLDEILDQGDTWEFELSRGRADLGVITVTRAELEDNGWKVVIPASVGRD
jgi:hypothetical protein